MKSNVSNLLKGELDQENQAIEREVFGTKDFIEAAAAILAVERQARKDSLAYHEFGEKDDTIESPSRDSSASFAELASLKNHQAFRYKRNLSKKFSDDGLEEPGLSAVLTLPHHKREE